MCSQAKRLESGLRSQQSFLRRTQRQKSAGEDLHLLSEEECPGLRSWCPNTHRSAAAKAA